MEFTAYPKTPRLKRSVVITEKIDGTNAQIVIREFAAGEAPVESLAAVFNPMTLKTTAMLVGSRNRWITPGKDTDNFGFAGWCLQNAPELFALGLGQHFGEWYGQGIGRTYGLDHKRFALFNTARWGAHNPDTPACCEVVPLLKECGLDRINEVLDDFAWTGSAAVPGFMNPEGIIVYHSASKQNFKVLFDNDDMPKGLS